MLLLLLFTKKWAEKKTHVTIENFRLANIILKRKFIFLSNDNMIKDVKKMKLFIINTLIVLYLSAMHYRYLRDGFMLYPVFYWPKGIFFPTGLRKRLPNIFNRTINNTIIFIINN